MNNEFNKYIEDINTAISEICLLDIDVFENQIDVMRYCKTAFDNNEISNFVAEHLLTSEKFIKLSSPNELIQSYNFGKTAFDNGFNITLNPYCIKLELELFHKWNEGWQDTSYEYTKRSI
jgi:hypothetical protein